MSISFSCPSCAKKFKTGKETANRRARCVACGTIMQVPAAPELGPEIDLYGLADSPDPVPATTLIRERGPEKRRTRASGPRDLLQRLPGPPIAWLTGCGVLALVFALVLMSNKGGTTKLLAVAVALCFVATGIQVVVATIRQGTRSIVAMVIALSATLNFLTSLIGRSKLTPAQAGVSMIIPYIFIYMWAQRRELYRGAALTGFSGIALLILLFVSNLPKASPGPVDTKLKATGARRYTVDFQPAIARGRPAKTMLFPGFEALKEIQAGVEFVEIPIPNGPEPDESGKLWLYLPSGEHAPKSLPAVLITAAGSNLINGNSLSEGSRAEHIPYVRGGFAVLAYETAGAPPDGKEPTDRDIFNAARTFLAAKAGLANAEYALEFLLTCVPEVDPNRLYAAGHSSAGTTAILFTEFDIRIKGCVAYAAETDLTQRFGPDIRKALGELGLSDLTSLYNPRGHEYQLSSPLMLFHARDDTNVPVEHSEDCATRLRGLDKPHFLEIAPTGGHYDAMIRQGIPSGVTWLRKLAGLDTVTVGPGQNNRSHPKSGKY